MIDYTDVDAKLEEYSNAFDFYMDNGRIPPYIAPDDCLAKYMKSVIDDNPQIDNSDPLWTEVLKDDLITFFKTLLDQFRTMQLKAQKELNLIQRFANATIETKRKMWQEVAGTIQNGYSQREINLPGYTLQFKSEDKEAVFSALVGDWDSACRDKLERQELRMLESSKKVFEQISRDSGSSDYEERKKLDAYIHRYPALREIVNIIGRNSDPKDDEDSVIYKFLPTNVAKNSSTEEIDRVETGNFLERILPVEFAMPEDLFFKRYATKELQQFGSRGKDKPRKVEEQKKSPRLTKGPIIVSIDTSGSMTGQPLKIAFSLLRQLLRMAKKQKRPCFLISFSVRARSIDLSKPRNWGLLDSFLENGFSGGTDGEQMLSEALQVLQQGTFEMGDVLIISDLQFPDPIPETRKKIQREQALGTRFYALQIGSVPHSYMPVLDRIWQV